VSTSAAGKIDDSAMPNLSMQQMIAVMLVDGTVSFKAAHDEALVRDPGITRHRQKVKVIADESLERLLPRRVAAVEVVFADGTVETERHDTVRGTPENPMSSEEVAAKARDLIVPVLGEKQCEALIECVFALDDLQDVRALRPLLQRKRLS
jgi:2-methylcitrate dehydratase PrpD